MSIADGIHAATNGDGKSKTPTTPRFDRSRTFAFLEALEFDPAIGCAEVRVLKGNLDRTGFITTDPKWKSTFTGYFDRPDALIVAASKLKDISGYISVNPLSLDLLARSDNELIKAEYAAADDDVTCLRWWYSDFDSKRRKGISATDAELAKAIGRRDQFLADHPELASAAHFGCSGNGAWCVIRLPDFPNDDHHRSLIVRATAVLAARYSDDAVEIDTSTTNAGRVMPLVGTAKCKGSNRPERPWRLATIDSPSGRREPIDLAAWLERNEPTKAEEPAKDEVWDTTVPPKRAERERDDEDKPEVHHDRKAVAAALKGQYEKIAAGWGLKLTEKVQKGWRVCHAVGRKDSTPSAGLNVESGVYRDFSGPIEESFFDLGVRLGIYTAWQEAVNDLGERFGLSVKAKSRKSKAAKPSPNGDGKDHESEAAKKDDYPWIQCNHTGLEAATRKTVNALEYYNELPQMFNTGGSLSRLKMTVGDDPRPMIDLMSGDALRNRMAEVASFYEEVQTKSEVKRRLVFPPRDIVKAIMAQASWSEEMAPELNSIAETPRFGRDGNLITAAGFHPDARLYYAPLAGLDDLAIPFVPTAEQVDAAKAFIFDEYLVDFPFAEPASKANALACMLLPFVRPMIDGPTPLHLVEASTEGTGKGKLAVALAFPASGHDLTSTPQKEDEAEWRKALTTALVSGVETIYFDNMYNPKGWDDTLLPIDSGTLAAVLTQTIWRDRILGVTKDATIPIRAVFMGSGNNLEWSKELKRRIVPIVLKAPIENPSERTGFKHDPLEEWARQNHRELLRACLILCQNWIAEDRPKGKQVMGSYETYVKVMGGILDAAMVPHFLGNLPKGPGKDRESVRWAALVEAWYASRGGMATSSAELHAIIFGAGNSDLQIAFADMGEGSVLSQKQRLGNALRKQEGRVWGKYRIVLSAAKGSGGTLLYKLVDPDEEAGEEPF